MRRLTITVERHGWDTHQIEVPDDFDATDDQALTEVAIDHVNDDNWIEGEITYFDVTVNKDEAVPAESREPRRT